MVVNLLDNVRSALEGFPVTSLVGWLDSSVALHWIRGEGEYKMFMANRVNKIFEHEGVTWRHVPSKDNPADVASRGGLIDEENQMWWKGPNWLSKPGEWPPDQKTTDSAESSAEVKLTKQLFVLAKNEDNDLVNLLSKFTYWKTLRITAWLLQFLGNVRCSKEGRIDGPLTTCELVKAEELLIVNAQQQVDETFKRDQLQLNLQKNEDGVLECRGRVQGFLPNLHIRFITASKKVCRACPQIHASWRSWANNGQGSRTTLDSPVTKVSKASHQRLSWV